ncbi:MULTISPECIES: glyoxylate/hydroxypyruvate reductase A [unclassified Herbaspirillum]|uniref:2-hydroxyacid dehydrogenase n=1 Tax=unclassified Herbaspirillum TaxID=2624150 RepID=UPI0011546F69|nr:MULTISPECIES: glyoxylate/hydroxypyruvate reductase A [unclassified Herbaspirillum]MBB5393296.1 glyoxylate/hydroxypyruvate reductase A [Herbaspirillum sp. SJZ102]TQK03955.1 glyoxylate/hydroxypyruvate reductase A [Herbaspirillum sp. SJZ130]TQK08687.1 glyoxylate/hydroxypyruvate reductase A [Herbaspirillum sp. SJZ106]TWC71958.1 glyoxylate/hydroxypyruvate reductase A [Herbaspirillum sp. SJZ099]
MSGAAGPAMAPIPFVSQGDVAAVQAWLKALRAAMPGECVVEMGELNAAQRAQCKLAVVANPDPAELKRLPQLEWVHSVWAGVERLVEDLGDSSLQLTRLVDPRLAATMAEAVLAWTLYLHRDMPLYAQRQRSRLWQAEQYVLPEQRTVGILGLGALGEAAAEALLQARFKVCGWSRKRRELAGVRTFSGEPGLAEMLAMSDILVCLLPLTGDTRGLLNAQRLALLPPQAQLINFARGPIVDDQALRAALDARALRHAVLDVFATEPLPVDSWHWDHPDVTVLPHCSAPTNRETASAIVAGNVRHYRQTGEIPANVDMRRGY